MFWKLGFHNQKAPLEALLERDDVKLEEVLDQDDFLQEAKAGNDRLLSFLSQPESVRKLLQYTTESVIGDDVDDKRRFKFPYLACELLVADIPMVDAAIVESRDNLKLLFDFLIQPAPLPQALSLYFVRVLQTLYTKRPHEVIQYVTDQDQALAANFIRHIETFGMNELILTLLGTMDEENRVQNGGCISQWWMDHHFVPQLFERLTSEYSADIHINIIRMLCELVRRFNNPNIAQLAQCLMTPEAARQLLALMLDDLRQDTKSIIFTEGTNLVISIIDSLVRKEDACRQMREKLQHDGTGAGADALEQEVDRNVNLTLHAILERVADLVAFLQDPGPLEELAMTWTALSPPLGLSRLKSVELLLVVMKTKKRYVEDAIIQLNMINICLDLFFQYDMNNLLHILVDEIVTSCLVSDNAELITCLFKECRILERILAAVKEDTGGTAGRPRAMRRGYYGHVTSMANKICQAEEQQPLVKGFTQQCEGWHEYVTGPLAARNTADTMVLGGANPMGLRNGDLLDGMETYSYANTAPQFDMIEVPEDAEEMTLPVAAPHKYAPSNKDPVKRDLWANAIPEDADELSPPGACSSRDADFDSRGMFLDDDKFETPKADEEEVWQERQIVDNTAAATALDADWGRFDDAPYSAPAAPPANPPAKQTITFYDVEEDSSSSDDEAHFVPSPVKAAAAPAPGPSATSPPVTGGPSHGSPPVTIVSSAPVSEARVDPSGGNDDEVPPGEDRSYSDFSYWQPNWADVSS